MAQPAPRPRIHRGSHTLPSRGHRDQRHRLQHAGRAALPQSPRRGTAAGHPRGRDLPGNPLGPLQPGAVLRPRLGDLSGRDSRLHLERRNGDGHRCAADRRGADRRARGFRIRRLLRPARHRPGARPAAHRRGRPGRSPARRGHRPRLLAGRVRRAARYRGDAARGGRRDLHHRGRGTPGIRRPSPGGAGNRSAPERAVRLPPPRDGAAGPPGRPPSPGSSGIAGS